MTDTERRIGGAIEPAAVTDSNALVAPPTSSRREGPVPDPTDAADLGTSTLSNLSRSALVVSLAQVGVALGVVMLAVLDPGFFGFALGRVVGIVLVVLAFVAVWIAGRDPATNGRLAVAGGLIGLVGAPLIADPDRWLTLFGWAIGVVMAGFGLAMIVPALRGRRRARNVRLGGGLVIAGILVGFVTTLAFQLVAVLAGLAAAASGLIVVGIRLGVVAPLPADEGRRRPVLVRWIETKGSLRQRRTDIYDAVFFEGHGAPARIGRFMLMMLFASVISAAGVLSDSTAVVIGAMLVAPLISPMMGVGLSLVTGWPNRLGRSTLVVVAGSLLAIVTGWVLTAAADVGVDLNANSQIISRSSPGLIDLVIAVAAGAAGAYALSRKDASSSLPGVAVAIALVPPLSVVGITAQQGDWEQASGTLLLFLTNLVAIILAGGLVFVLTGVVPIRRFADNQHRVRTALVAVVTLAALVVGGLVINGQQIARDSFAQDTARHAIVEWLGDDGEFSIASVDAVDSRVTVVLTGPGEPPDASALVRELADSLGHDDLELDLQWIPRQRRVLVAGE